MGRDTKTEEREKPKGRLPLGAAIALVAAAAVAASSYVVFRLDPRLDRLSYGPLATGAMADFEIGWRRPAQPDTPLVDAQGQPVTLARWRGEVLVVNLWATWCPPCVEEMPTLAALQTAYAGQGLKVAAVSVDRDGALAKSDLARLTGGALAFYEDPAFKIPYALQAPGFPTTIVYGRDGREIGRVMKAADWASPQAKALIEKALAE